MKHYVIAGNGVAAAGCVEGIRSVDPEGPITLVSRENHPVYAAGDCAEGYDLSLGANRVLALLPSAYIQGYTAGVNMAGGRQVFDRGIPMNAIGFFGMHIMTAGTYVSEAGGGRVFAWSQGGKVKKFFCKDGLLKGYILIDAVDRGGIYTALIREQTPLDTVDLPLLVREPTFMAFPAQARKEKFASEV